MTLSSGGAPSSIQIVGDNGEVYTYIRKLEKALLGAVYLVQLEGGASCRACRSPVCVSLHSGERVGVDPASTAPAAACGAVLNYCRHRHGV